MIEVEGVQALLGDFSNAKFMVAVRAASQLKEASEKVVERAKQHAPKKRGHLRDSITAEALDHGFTWEIGPENARGGGYGHIVEKGYTRQAPQPYLGPALDEVEPQMIDGFEKMMERLL